MRGRTPPLRASGSRAADRRAQSGQGGARSSKDDQAVRHARPHIGVAEAGRRPQPPGLPLRRGAISVSSSKQGALGARSSRQKEVEMTKARDAAALRVAPLDTPTDLRPTAVPEISGAL